MPRFSGVLAMMAVTAACTMQDPSTPVSQPDTIIFGRISAIAQDPNDATMSMVEVQGGLPESIAAVLRREGRPVPETEKDYLVTASVSGDTVVVFDHEATDLGAFRVGEEVAVLPVPGTTSMVGSKTLLMEAKELYRFSAYKRAFLPNSLDVEERAAEGASLGAVVNSRGLERTPLPLAGGKVIYFAAGMLPPVAPEMPARGRERDGMRVGDGLAPWVIGGYRPYRVEWGGSGWGEAAPVTLGGVPENASVRITWVNSDETACLAEVDDGGSATRLLSAKRSDRKHAWGELGEVPRVGEDGSGDGQLFGRAADNLVWTVYDAESSDLWLAMSGQEGQPLEPKINTRGSEWSPRVGPGTTLFFCRGDRQLLLSGGVVQEVRLPGRQRRPLLEAAPTADGRLLFFRVPRYGVAGIDWDLAVATREGEGWSVAVPVDEWSPITPS